MELVFIRHGESKANDLQKEDGSFFCGRWECDLTDKGRAHARTLRESEAVAGADAVIVSPLRRAVETVNEFAAGNIVLDERLLERSLGDFEGKWQREVEEKEEYRKYFTEKRYAHFRNSFTVCAPNGESYTDVVARVTPFLEELKRKDYKKVVIVSHAIAIRCMLKVLKNLSEEETINYKVKQCEPIFINFFEKNEKPT